MNINILNKYELIIVAIYRAKKINKECTSAVSNNCKDITMALISHDIAVISEVSESILVMNEGKIVEKGDCKKVLSSPNHEYTKHLLSCIPEWMK